MLARRRKRRWRQLVWGAAVRRGGGMIFTCHEVDSSQYRWLLPSFSDALCFTAFSSPLDSHHAKRAPAVHSAAVAIHDRDHSSVRGQMSFSGMLLPASWSVLGRNRRRNAYHRGRGRAAASATDNHCNLQTFMAWSKDRCRHLRPQSSDNGLRSACSPSLTLPLRAQIVYLSAQLGRLLA